MPTFQKHSTTLLINKHKMLY